MIAVEPRNRRMKLPTLEEERAVARRHPTERMCGCIADDICLSFDDTSTKTRAGQIMHQRLAQSKSARAFTVAMGSSSRERRRTVFNVHVAAYSTALISALNALLDFFVNHL